MRKVLCFATAATPKAIRLGHQTALEMPTARRIKPIDDRDNVLGIPNDIPCLLGCHVPEPDPGHAKPDTLPIVNTSPREKPLCGINIERSIDKRRRSGCFSRRRLTTINIDYVENVNG